MTATPPATVEPRLVLVSNRLPATVRVERGNVRVVPSSGGLATGLRTPHARSGGLWFGWPGDVSRLRPEQREELDRQLGALRLCPVHLSRAEIQHYYEGFSNGVLWPLFHYLLDHVPFGAQDWEVYRAVNERFAAAVAAQHQPGDLVWVQDYQLLLVPQLLRQLVPGARIGFFLHIPFPSSEVFRILARREEVLRGLLGADLIGFHTHAYLGHFTFALLRNLGLDVEIDRVWHEGRAVRLGVYPMGIDAQSFADLAADPTVLAEAAQLRAAGHGRMILGVDRLDYTKGIPSRLLAFERLLEREPALRGQVRFLQVAVTSRAELRSYEDFKRQVDELVGRINGRYGTVRYTPIQYVNQSLAQRQLVPLYRAADVMAVTPLRDGLNLVAKEFLACRADLDAVLVLSEFAGAAAELPEALIVNPYDLDAVAAAYAQALTMDPGERAERLRAMRERVLLHDVHHWARDFLTDLELAGATSAGPPLEGPLPMERAEDLARPLRAAPELLLLCDYDGTLVPLVSHPDLAAPDDALLQLLARLGRRPRTALHLVSGRDRASLTRWLGELPVALHAEHGLWSRAPGEQTWTQTLAVDPSWKEQVRPILDAFVKCAPGSFVEDKSAGIAWHYRRCAAEVTAVQVRELRLHLLTLLSSAPVEVLAGDKVVEVRALGAHKGAVVTRLLERDHADALIVVAIGDDRTDEDLFAALPESGVSIHVGTTPSRARYRLPDPQAVRALLTAIADG